MTTPDGRTYALGHSEDEFKRLAQQGAFFRDLTEDVLRRAGIEPGMRVLDIGCGVGDVSLLVGELVGSTGLVLGVDRSTDAVETASARAAAAAQRHLRFVTGELDEFATDEMFDAVVGRLILMYLADPSAALRQVCKHLRPGGIVAFQEMSMPMGRCIPEAPLVRRSSDWIIGTFERAGFEVDMGAKLFATFLAAGLPPPEMIAGGRVGGGPGSPVYRQMAGVLRSLLPVAEKLGVATAAEVDIDTLADRLEGEAVALNATVIAPILIGALDEVAGLTAQSQPLRLK